MLRDWLLRIPYLAQLGYVLVFLGAFLETIPGAGIVIPGQTMVVLGGFLAHEGILNTWLVLAVAAAGAILGDWMGFLLGRRFGLQYFFRQQGFLKETVSLLHAHPKKTLILGRFNSLARAFAPFAAGASGIRVHKFLFANIVGGVVWAAVWVLLGRLFGASYELASHALERILLFSAIAALLAFGAYRYLRKRQLARRHAKYLLGTTVLASVLFSLLVYLVRTDSALVAVDVATHQWTVGHRHGALVTIAKLCSLLLHPLSIALLTASMIGLLWLRHNKRRAVMFGTLVVGAAVLDAVLKAVILRARPVDGLLVVGSPSFPSGHAFLGITLAGGILLSYLPYSYKKTAWSIGLSAAVLLTSLSRVYLGVHWLSDILGGWTVGIAWVSLVFLCDEAYRMYRDNQKERLYRS